MHRFALEDENEGASEMAKNAGDEDEPDELPIGLVRLIQDAEIRKTEGDLEAGDTCHVEGSPGEVDLYASSA
jgi:hypothetical protein